jgi:hypothetical protein
MMLNNQAESGTQDEEAELSKFSSAGEQGLEPQCPAI